MALSTMGSQNSADATAFSVPVGAVHTFSAHMGVALCMLATLLCQGALAALGAAPLPNGQNLVVSTEASVVPGAVYTVSVTTLPSGTVMREYVSTTGRVFAVRWDGPLLPDLAMLLGDYASEYQQAVQQQRAMGQRGGALQTQTSQLVMVSRGRMGQFKGHAYVPALVPVGLDMSALLP